jgi:hypothetical protein
MIELARQTAPFPAWSDVKSFSLHDFGPQRPISVTVTHEQARLLVTLVGCQFRQGSRSQVLREGEFVAVDPGEAVLVAAGPNDGLGGLCRQARNYDLRVIIMGVQFIKTPVGDEMAVLPRAEYDALIEAALEAGEDAADIAAYEAAKQTRSAPHRYPSRYRKRCSKGRASSRHCAYGATSLRCTWLFKTETSQGLISDLENRRRHLTEEMARRLSIALDIPRDWLG